MPSHLPLPWIDSLFARLVTAWGRDFLAQYEGVDIGEVKADWAARLGGFHVTVDGKPAAPAVAYALERLPDRPVNALQFRKLCLGYTPAEQLALPAPPPDPERVRAELSRLAAPVSDEPTHVRWARQYIRMWAGHRKLIARRATELARAMRIVREFEEAQKHRAASEQAAREQGASQEQSA